MKRYLFLIIIAILTAVLYLWSIRNQETESEVYVAKEGQLLLPQRSVAIVTLDLKNTGVSFSNAEQLLRLRPLQQDFMEIRGVTKVESILSVSRVISEHDEIIVAKVIPSENSEITDAYLEQVASEIHEFPELSPYINASLDTILFYIYFANKISAQHIHRELTALQEKWSDSIRFEFTGRSPVIAETESLLTDDISLFFPVLAAMVIIIFSFFRNIKAIFISLLLIATAIAFAYVFVRFLGIPNSPLLLLLPVFSLGLLSDYLIHYFYHRLYSPIHHRNISPRKLLFFPLSLTALSTLIGFLSLSLINGSGHLQLGLIIASAVIIVWFGIFYWVDFGKYKPATKHMLASFKTTLGKAFSWVAKNKFFFYAIIVAATAWGIMQIGNLSIEPYPIEQLPETTTIKKADHIINEEFYGTVPFFIEIDTGEKNGLLSKNTMLELDRIHQHLQANEVGYSYSLLTVLKRMNFYFRGDEESLLTSTDFDNNYDALIEQYLLYYSSSVDPLEYESLLDHSYRLFSIKGLLHYSNYDDLDRFMKLLNQIQSDFPDGWTMSVHSMARQLETEQSNLRKNWVFSFLGGSFLIFIAVLIFYRKLTLALLSLVPSIISMTISLGFISLAGIRIDVFSIIFVAIITGLVIDYSIHTLVALNQLKSIENLRNGFSQVIGYSGIPIFLSFLTSLLSFSVLFFSSFSGARNLGFLLLFSLVFSFFLSLFLIPLIILPIRLSKELNNA